MVDSKGIIIGTPCDLCGKTMRNDYPIGKYSICMDCADELGVSEVFRKDPRQLVKVETLESAINIMKRRRA